MNDWSYKRLRIYILEGFHVASVVKNLPVKKEIHVQSLNREDPPEKEMATHCTIFAWEIPWTDKPGRLQSMWFQKS